MVAKKAKKYKPTDIDREIATLRNGRFLIANRIDVKHIYWYVVEKNEDGMVLKPKTQTPIYIKCLFFYVVPDDDAVDILLYENISDRDRYYKKKVAEEARGELDPDVESFGRIRFKEPLKKVGDQWYSKQ